MKNTYKNILNDYIINTKGIYDYHMINGSYGISWNYGLDYVSIYKIIVYTENTGFYYINNYPYHFNMEEYNNKNLYSYEIKEIFFQGSEHYAEIFGTNFLNNSESTQFKKIRNYFKEYEY